MTNRGTGFEGKLKKALIEQGLDVFHLGQNERADLLVVGKRTRLVECKVKHVKSALDPYYFSKNAKQHQKLIELSKTNQNLSIYYAIDFYFASDKKHEIAFFFLPHIIDKKGVSLFDNHWNLQEFAVHVRALNV